MTLGISSEAAQIIQSLGLVLGAGGVGAGAFKALKFYIECRYGHKILEAAELAKLKAAAKGEGAKETWVEIGKIEAERELLERKSALEHSLSVIEIKTAHRAQIREKNANDVLRVALGEVKDDLQEELPSVDFVNRLMDIAEDVSEDDLKILWGKILGGEFNSPGTFSLRTLEILKNMTSHEAHIFHNFSKATVETSFGGYRFCVLINDDLHRYYIKRFWLAYDQISFLKEIGLVRSEFTENYFSYQKGRHNYLSFEKGKFQLAVKLLEGKQGITVGTEVLTKSGIELLSLIEQEDDLELLEEIKKAFEKNAEVRITDAETRHREGIKTAIEFNKAKNQDFFLVAVGGNTTLKFYAEYYKVPVEVLAEFNELPADATLTVDTVKIPSNLFDEEGNVK
jgi:hypothetical protein